MSQLTYNGVSINYLSTSTFSYDDEMSEDGVDYLRTKVTVTVQGLVSGGASLNATQHALEQPRKELLFINGANTLVDLDATSDVKNGPFPRVLMINRISGSTFIVAFTVTAYQYRCTVNAIGADDKPTYISHRWNDTEARNNQWLAVRTRRGKLVVLGGASKTDLSAESSKEYVIPAIPEFFTRESAEFSYSEDGLTMSYQVVDKELIQQPPIPSVEAEMEYNEVRPYPGAKRKAVVTVKMKYPKLFLTESQLNGFTSIAGMVVLTAISQGLLRLTRAGLPIDTLTKRPAIERSIHHNVSGAVVTVTQMAWLTPVAPTWNYSDYHIFPWGSGTDTPPFNLQSEGLKSLPTSKPNKMCTTDPTNPGSDSFLTATRNGVNA